MKVFISHSGDRSLALAETLEGFIRKVIHGTEPWLSATGIDKGARWPSEVRDNLNQAAAGVICLTSENLDARWILFEAGALSLKATDRVWTFLLDVEHAQVEPPLSDFLHTKAEKADVFKMIRSIHKTVVASGEKTNNEDDLSEAFDIYWTRTLEPTIVTLRAQAPASPPPQRSASDLLAEVLDLVRQMDRNIDRSLSRQEKTLQMLVPSPLAVLRRLASEQADAARVSDWVGAVLAEGGLLTFEGGKPKLVVAPSETEPKKD